MSEHEQKILTRLDKLEATALLTIESCRQLREELCPVSTGTSKNKGLSQKDIAKVLSRRRTHMIKKQRNG